MLSYSVPLPPEGGNYVSVEWKKCIKVAVCFKAHVSARWIASWAGARNDLCSLLQQGVLHEHVHPVGFRNPELYSARRVFPCFPFCSLLGLSSSTYLLFLRHFLSSLDRTVKRVASAGGFLKQNKKKPCLCGSSDRYLKEKSDRSLVWANIFVLRAAEQIGLTGTNPHLKAVVWNHAGYILSTHEIVFTFQNFFSSAFP